MNNCQNIVTIAFTILGYFTALVLLAAVATVLIVLWRELRTDSTEEKR